jgi:hypothetical protein
MKGTINNARWQGSRKRIKFSIQTRIRNRKPFLLDAFIFKLIRTSFSKTTPHIFPAEMERGNLK